MSTLTSTQAGCVVVGSEVVEVTVSEHNSQQLSDADSSCNREKEVDVNCARLQHDFLYDSATQESDDAAINP